MLCPSLLELQCGQCDGSYVKMAFNTQYFTLFIVSKIYSPVNTKFLSPIPKIFDILLL